MGKIAIENLKFFAHHGVYDEEKTVGNEFIVDVYVDVALDSNTKVEQLNETLNYETIFHCCKKVIQIPQPLLETVCIDIVKALKIQFLEMNGLIVRVRKLNPMPGERVGSSFIEIEENFASNCSSCGKSLKCYNSENCWCSGMELTADKRAILNEKFNGCLCMNCLKQYGS